LHDALNRRGLAGPIFTKLTTIQYFLVEIFFAKSGKIIFEIWKTQKWKKI
jgi:hypothetical protein